MLICLALGNNFLGNNLALVICLALGNNSALTVRDCPIVRFVCVTVSPMSPAHNPHIRSTKKFYKFIHFTETLKNEIVYVILYCIQQKETEI